MAHLEDLTQALSLNDLSKRLNIPEESIVESLQGVAFPELKYQLPEHVDQFRMLTEATQSLDEILRHPSLDQHVANWDKRWQDILTRIDSNGVDIQSLRPVYFGKRILRLDGKFIVAFDESFEFKLHISILKALFKHYFPNTNSFVELGCGTGLNLLLLSQLFPTARFQGGDWASVSQQILTRIAKHTKTDLSGFNFNLRTLDGGEQINCSGESAILTIHALEQIGQDFEAILSFILAQEAALVFHIEPLIELYDPTSELDKISIRYHRHQNYLEGYLPTLQKLEKKGIIEILECRRLGFGSTWHEAYSLLVWRRKL